MRKILGIAFSSAVVILVLSICCFYQTSKPSKNNLIKSVHIKNKSEIIYDKYGDSTTYTPMTNQMPTFLLDF